MYYCEQLGTYILFITNYVKYNTYFNESSFTKLHTLSCTISIMCENDDISFLKIILILYTYVYYWW